MNSKVTPQARGIGGYLRQVLRQVVGGKAAMYRAQQSSNNTENFQYLDAFFLVLLVRSF
jgi:hypothetical protein